MLSGYCHCCRSQVSFVISGAWLRDQYHCTKCGSIPRQRHLQHILDKFFPNWEKSEVHESSPSNNYISQYCKRYTLSQYLPEIPFGSYTEDGIRSENLEDLTLAPESVDIFITQDVFEHLFRPDKAAKEIAKALAPGGIHIFTAPKHEGVRRSFPMARLLDGGDIELLHHPPEYHGNPVGDGQSLVTWRYGDDFEFLLSQWSGLPVTTYTTRDWTLGIDAVFNEVFVMKKPDVH
jgi:SAM-dependent methyltransferase